VQGEGGGRVGTAGGGLPAGGPGRPNSRRIYRSMIRGAGATSRYPLSRLLQCRSRRRMMRPTLYTCMTRRRIRRESDQLEGDATLFEGDEAGMTNNDVVEELDIEVLSGLD